MNILGKLTLGTLGFGLFYSTIHAHPAKTVALEPATQSVVAQVVQATPKAEAKPEIEFGKPHIKNEMGFATITVQVTNNGKQAYQVCTFSGALVTKDDEVLEIANGFVNNLAPGQKRALELMGESAKAADHLTLQVETCLEAD
jgi:hypothetical protein